MLEEIGLSCEQERAVLEFACDIALMPYNRRTSRPLIAIVNFVKSIIKPSQQQQQAHQSSSSADNFFPPKFEFPIRKAFKWWWAFCKKYSVISLYYKEKSQNANVPIFEAEEKTEKNSSSSSSSSSSLQNQDKNEQKQCCNNIFASADSNSGFAATTLSSAPPAISAAATPYPIFYYPSPYFYALSEINSQAYNTSVRKMK